MDLIPMLLTAVGIPVALLMFEEVDWLTERPSSLARGAEKVTFGRLAEISTGAMLAGAIIFPVGSNFSHLDCRYSRLRLHIKRKRKTARTAAPAALKRAYGRGYLDGGGKEDSGVTTHPMSASIMSATCWVW